MTHDIQLFSSRMTYPEPGDYDSDEDTIIFEGSSSIPFRPMPLNSSETALPQNISQDVQLGCCGKIKDCFRAVFCCKSMTSDKPSSLKDASEKGNAKLVERILDDFALRSEYDTAYLKQCLQIAYKNNHLECVALLIANGVSIAAFNPNLDTLLHLVIKDIKTHLNDRNFSLKEQLTNLAIHIIENTPRELLMIKNKEGMSPFDYACHWRLSTIAIELLTKIQVPAKDYPLLFMAINDKDQPLARALIESEHFNINKPNSVGEYPLIEAAKRGCQDTIKALIQNGASIHCKDKEGRTAVWHAIQNMHPAATKLLIESIEFNSTLYNFSQQI